VVLGALHSPWPGQSGARDGVRVLVCWRPFDQSPCPLLLLIDYRVRAAGADLIAHCESLSFETSSG